jgi:hypothetical protein
MKKYIVALIATGFIAGIFLTGAKKRQKVNPKWI